MKKIGIITLVGNENFGNKLQNYALQKQLEKHNCKAETLNITSKDYKDKIYGRKFRLLRKIKRAANSIKKSFDKEENIRKKTFIEYSDNYINNSNKNITLKNIDNYVKKYDAICFGSDQIWSPYNDIPFYISLGVFNNTSKVRMFSYAASFGVSSIPENVKHYYAKGLSNIANISVREEAGKEIISDLLNNKDTKVLIDPTMLLSKEEWECNINRPKQLDNIKEDKFILNYFLGKLSDERYNEIKKIAIDNNCHIINILDKNDPFYTCGPSEFLYLEKNAFLICTDSFHSSVFAILFDRPFVVFDREGLKNSMNSRIDTLINKFKLENRRYNGTNITLENIEHNYTEAFTILEKERKISDEFLTKVLSDEE